MPLQERPVGAASGDRRRTWPTNGRDKGMSGRLCLSVLDVEARLLLDIGSIVALGRPGLRQRASVLIAARNRLLGKRRGRGNLRDGHRFARPCRVSDKDDKSQGEQSA